MLREGENQGPGGFAAARAARLPIRLARPLPKIDFDTGSLCASMEGLWKTAARVEREAAAARARSEVMLDETAERLGEIEGRARKAVGAAGGQLEELCETAARVIGHDPRREAGIGRSRAGSLADLIERLETAVESANDAAARLGALIEQARSPAA